MNKEIEARGYATGWSFMLYSESGKSRFIGCREDVDRAVNAGYTLTSRPCPSPEPARVTKAPYTLEDHLRDGD